MNKKILIALSVVIVAIVAMGTVSAFDLSDLGSIFSGSPPDQNITLDGETFHIPGTFKENKNISKNGTIEQYSYFTTTSYARGYSNNTNFINILIFEYNGTDTESFTNYQNGTGKSINGTSGFITYDGIAYSFSYAKGNKVITIQSDKENLIANAIA